jgi:hypothetical protein
MKGEPVEWEGDINLGDEDVLTHVWAEGLYIPGSPGYFNPHDGGHPPEEPVIENLVVCTAGGDITGHLTVARIDYIIERLIEAAENGHGRD